MGGYVNSLLGRFVRERCSLNNGCYPHVQGVFQGMPLDGCKTTIDHDVENLPTSRDIGSGDTDTDLVPFGL